MKSKWENNSELLLWLKTRGIFIQILTSLSLVLWHFSLFYLKKKNTLCYVSGVFPFLFPVDSLDVTMWRMPMFPRFGLYWVELKIKIRHRNYNKKGVPTVASWAKNTTAVAWVTAEAMCELRCRSQLWLGFSHWPSNFHMLQVQALKKLQ